MNYSIRSWKVTYYLNDKQKWIHGTLTCTPSHAYFTAEDQTVKVTPSVLDSACEKDQEMAAGSLLSGALLQFHYEDILHIRKTKAMVIYAAVVLKMRNGMEHWLSSLQDQQSVFSMLHYFSQRKLVEHKNDRSLSADQLQSTTVIGQKLLQSAEDSHSTLAAAAGDLWGQGRQLAHAGVLMQELHEDLDIAERIIEGLDTWLGRWQLPSQYKQIESVIVNKDDIPLDQDFEVLCSELSKDHWHSQKLCILRTSNNGITLLDDRQRLFQTMHFIELTRVFVVSPWELILQKHIPGRADIRISVIHCSLLPILQLLQTRVPHLIDYQTMPKDFPAGESIVSGVQSDTGSLQRLALKVKDQSSSVNGTQQDKSGKHTKAGLKTGSDMHQVSLAQQVQQEETQSEVISEAEFQAMCSKLGEFKQLATTVGEELSAQDKAIDSLTEAVCHGDIRIQAANRKIKKLT